MLKILVPAMGVAMIAGGAMAQPTPAEQVGMFVGDNNTNGSAVVVTDRNGTHPEGYPGMSILNHAAAGQGVTPRRHHHHRHAFLGVPITQGR
ncbi:hypothetical protein [Phenylobacterium sp.]|uniref:hypothetical protein n=1 Tax=Phenylobacterium sp. TaxID=1871053 RepID=UPI002F42481D